MLRTRQVGKWVVSEIGALQSVRMSLFRKQADEYVTQAGDVLGLAETLSEWAQTSACVSPMLTIADYLDMTAVEIMDIVNAMAEVNETIPVETSKKKQSETT